MKFVFILLAFVIIPYALSYALGKQGREAIWQVVKPHVWFGICVLLAAAAVIVLATSGVEYRIL